MHVEEETEDLFDTMMVSVVISPSRVLTPTPLGLVVGTTHTHVHTLGCVQCWNGH